MRLMSLLAILLLLFSTSLFATSIPTDVKPAIEKLDSHIQDTLRKKIIPGCAVAIVYKNQIIFINGYGYRVMGKSDKIDADTIFQLGSISKPIAATLASVLEHKGLLKLDAPVNDYMPDFTLNTKENCRHLKVKNILSHSSGVSRNGFNNLIESYASYDTIVKTLKKTPVRCPIGKKYDYNNAMFSLLSTITQKATNQTFSKSLSENLLQPLNMARTSATLTGIVSTANRACPHIRTRKGLIPCETYSSSYYTVAPAGGINSSVRDMAIFLKAQMGGYPEILNRTVLARIHTPQISTQNMLQSQSSKKMPIKHAYYGLGWRITNVSHQKLIFHGGWLKGFTNFIGFLPEHNIGIVILHNGDSKFSARTAVKFFEYLLKPPKDCCKIIPSLGKSRKKTSSKFRAKKAKNVLSAKMPKTAKMAKKEKAIKNATLSNVEPNQPVTTHLKTNFNKKSKNTLVNSAVNLNKKSKNKTVTNTNKKTKNKSKT